MNKKHILEEIKRTAKANDGKPLGQGRFKNETGIKKTDWYGKFWARWNDALHEAGFGPNQLQAAFGKNELLDKYARYVLELGRLPSNGDLRRGVTQNSQVTLHLTIILAQSLNSLDIFPIIAEVKMNIQK
jgi:hypothetical protein